MTTSNSQRFAKVGLLLGAIALAGGIAIAHSNPATGYELSLYRSTPVGTWVGIGVAAAGGTTVGLQAWGRVRDGGLLLAGASALTVYALPILRGYYFYGAGDSLSHLGFMREIVAGQVAPVDILYPTIHVGTASMAMTADITLARACLYLVLVVFPLLFLAFIPLCVQLLTDSPHAVAIGILAALLFAPINHISVHPIAHPASQAILFLPVVLFVVLRYLTDAGGTAGSVAGVRSDGGRDHRRWASPIGLLLALLSAAVVLNHPQQALNVVVLFAAIAVTQVVYRTRRPDHPISAHRRLYAQTAFIAAFFLAWASRFPIVSGAVQDVVGRMVGGAAPAGEVVATRSQSVVAIGGDVGVLFLRLFLPAAILSLLAGLLILGVLRADLLDGDPPAEGLLVYLTAALVPLVAIFALFVGFGYDDMFFRYQGFIMVPVTVLGAVALVELLGVGLTRPTTSRRWLVAVLFVLLLPIAGMGLHPSPHLYQPTPHVAESQVHGYESSFEHRLTDQEFVGIRGGPRRYVDAVYGTTTAESTMAFPGYRERLPEPVFHLGNYTSFYEADRYLAVSPSAHEREVGLYDEFRYTEQGFSKLSSTPGVSRVRSSDGFQLYHIEAEDG